MMWELVNEVLLGHGVKIWQILAAHDARCSLKHKQMVHIRPGSEVAPQSDIFAIGKQFNCSFRKKSVVFRGRRRRWTENQFVRHDKLKVVRAMLSGTITLFTPSTTTQ